MKYYSNDEKEAMLLSSLINIEKDLYNNHVNLKIANKLNNESSIKSTTKAIEELNAIFSVYEEELNILKAEDTGE